jgi:hypothetical protein
LQNWQQIGSLLARLAVCAGAAALVAPASAHGWTWPVQGPVLRTFSFGSDPYAAGLHRGIDVGAPVGGPVVAPASGIVSFAGTVPGGGKTLSVETPDGYSVTLLHLGSLSVQGRAEVTEGDVVGSVGSSGTPELGVPYVHLGVRRAANPEGYLDPLLFLPPVVQPPPAGEPPGPEPVPGTAPAPRPGPPVVVAPPAETPHLAQPRSVPRDRNSRDRNRSPLARAWCRVRRAGRASLRRQARRRGSPRHTISRARRDRRPCRTSLRLPTTGSEGL